MTNNASVSLPAGVRVFERGWLSANNILFDGSENTALIDTGYWTHSNQTVTLVQAALGSRPLDLVLNTHLHSDHCGGNAALQQNYPGAHTLIPPGLSRFVQDWDPAALSYTSTGQQCPPFHFEGSLIPGQEIVLGSTQWQIHGAPGHDPNSVILFEPASRTLISADALWESGFGIVFEELEGEQAFAEVSATLDLIESLSPLVVIPGHGAIFFDAGGALSVARSKLEGFVRDPRKHARHAAKVLLKFKLLEVQEISARNFTDWAIGTAYLALVHKGFFGDEAFSDWIEQLIADLFRSGAARLEGDSVVNAG